MSEPDMTGRTPRISDARVKDKTGKTWSEWVALIDEKGYGELGRKGISSELERKHRVDPWWAHAISIEYQYARGMHHPSQRHSVTVAQFIEVEPKRAFAAWSSGGEMDRWFSSGTVQDFHVGGKFKNADGDSGEYLVIVPNKSIRFTWSNPHHQAGSEVGVRVYPDGEGTLVEVRHDRLASDKDAENLKTGWAWALDSLKSYLERGRRITWEEWVASAPSQSSER